MPAGPAPSIDAGFVEPAGVGTTLPATVPPAAHPHRRMSTARLLRALAALCALSTDGATAEPTPVIMTVTGPVAAAEVGPALTHEHVMSIFGAPAGAPGYDVAALRAAVLPALRQLHADGVAVVFDCTAENFGRDPSILRDLSHESGVRLVTNTGWYGAAGGRYLPASAHTLDVGAIAALWIAEARDGIAGTGIRPGFIKLGVNEGELAPVDRKLLAAAARTHLATGLTIAIHTGANLTAAAEQGALLRAEGVASDAWIWTHAHQSTSPAALLAAAQAGTWISLDNWTPESAARHLELLRVLKSAGLLHRVLLSHDGNLFPAGGRPPRPMRFLFTEVRARLRAAGFTDAEWTLLTETNPAAAFALRVRRAAPPSR